MLHNCVVLQDGGIYIAKFGLFKFLSGISYIHIWRELEIDILLHLHMFISFIFFLGRFLATPCIVFGSGNARKENN